MKPILLTIEGINSFSEKQTIEFDFDGLFCISGDTGSGKTTILDCIILALYGNGKRTPILNDYINIKRATAEVKLVFKATVDGESNTYEVTRIFKRAGNNRAKLVNLTTSETVAEQTENVNKAIESMIELKREDFTQVVILEQGRFSKFLTAGKKERNDTVGNLFKLNKYKDLGKRFSQKKELVKKELEAISTRLDELSEVTATAIREKEKMISTMKSRVAVIDDEEIKLAAEITTLEENKRKFDKCVEAEKELVEAEKNEYNLSLLLEKVNGDLDKTVHRLKEVTEQKAACELIAARGSAFNNLVEEKNKRVAALNALIKEWREADGEAKALEAGHMAAVEKSRKFKSSYDLLIDEIFAIADFGEKDEYYDIFDIKSQADKLIMELNTASESYAELNKNVNDCEEKVKTANGEVLTVMMRINEAKQRRDFIESELTALKAERERQRLLEAAHYIRQGLKEGDKCPVCGGTVNGECAQHKESFVEQILEQKEKALVEAEQYLNSLNNNLYSFSTRLDEYNRNLSDLKFKRDCAEKKYSELKAKVKSPQKIDALGDLTYKACDYSTKITNAQNLVGIEEQKLLAVTKRVEDIKKRGEAERSEVNRLEEVIKQELDFSEEELKQNKEKLTLLTSEIENLTNNRVEQEGKRESLILEWGAIKATIERLKEMAKDKPTFEQNVLDAKLGYRNDLKKEKENLIAGIAGETKELESLNKNLEIKRGYEAQKAVKKKEYDIFSDIFKIVSGDKFIEYIAEEYILQFTQSASIVLSEITGGKYTLEYKEGEFYVRDFLSGGMERKVDTLSGGETFLTSLSLAIAISREIARYKTYEFFFLDEGFGTLDSASLDTVINALMALSGDTLVGVVTHRSEITERIFDKITVLAADGERGSLVIRSN